MDRHSSNLAALRALDGLAPLDVLRCWPIDRSVVMLHSGRLHESWARWSILTSPSPDGWAVIDGNWPNQGGLPFSVRPRSADCGDRDAPFCAGWIGTLSYDLGRVIEPASGGERLPMDNRHWPLGEFAYCPGALLFDHAAQRWSIGGDETFARDLIERLRGGTGNGHDDTWSAGELRSSLTPDAYLNAVAQTKEYIAAGDIFQANITQRLSAQFSGSSRALACEALSASGAMYGAYMELPGGRCLVSMSPELFLDVRSNRAVTSRPIKGTRPASADPAELRDSVKDAAELHMIVDLMRNDLGRVCELGSIRLPHSRTIETYPTVHHGVAEISGMLRSEVSIGELLGATFPGGSVTGAPKIRAMQIIDELEPVRRGPYCGSIGFLDESGNCTLNIAIRTIALTGERAANRWGVYDRATLDYGTGGGIVADSEPAEEYRESQQKAEILRTVLASAQPVG